MHKLLFYSGRSVGRRLLVAICYSRKLPATQTNDGATLNSEIQAPAPVLIPFNRRSMHALVGSFCKVTRSLPWKFASFPLTQTRSSRQTSPCEEGKAPQPCCTSLSRTPSRSLDGLRVLALASRRRVGLPSLGSVGSTTILDDDTAVVTTAPDA